MEDTWQPRDLPILDAIVRHFEESDDPYLPGIPTEETFAEVTGRDVREVRKAVQNLRQSYLVVQDGGLGDSMILDVTDEARRAVGLWPTPGGDRGPPRPRAPRRGGPRARRAQAEPAAGGRGGPGRLREGPRGRGAQQRRGAAVQVTVAVN